MGITPHPIRLPSVAFPDGRKLIASAQADGITRLSEWRTCGAFGTAKARPLGSADISELSLPAWVSRLAASAWLHAAAELLQSCRTLTDACVRDQPAPVWMSSICMDINAAQYDLSHHPHAHTNIDTLQSGLLGHPLSQQHHLNSCSLVEHTGALAEIKADVAVKRKLKQQSLIF